MSLHEELSKLTNDQVIAAAGPISLQPSHDAQDPLDNYPALEKAGEFMVDVLQKSGFSEEQVMNMGMGALMIAQILAQCADVSRLQG